MVLLVVEKRADGDWGPMELEAQHPADTVNNVAANGFSRPR